MSRITLIHWSAPEAQSRATQLERAGHSVTVHADNRAAPLTLRENPPDVFVIDLSRLPSHGRETGVWLRNQKATRHVPLVFIEGEPDKTGRVRELLPDAVYADWRHIRGAIRRAVQHAPHTPIVPGAFDSYSGTPLPKKLGINAGAVVALLGAPEDFERNDLFLAEMAHFLSVIRGETQPACTLGDGIRALEIALAASRSADEQILVSLNRESSLNPGSVG